MGVRIVGVASVRVSLGAALACVLMSATGHAQAPARPSLPNVTVEIEEDGVTARDAQVAKSYILDAVPRLGHVRQPKDVQIRLGKYFDNAFAYHFVELFTPTQLLWSRPAKMDKNGQVRLKEKALLKNPTSMRAVVDHEYGHLVMLENASARFKEFQTLQFTMSQAEFYNQQYNAILKELAPYEPEADAIKKALEEAPKGSQAEKDAQARKQALQQKVSPIVARLKERAAKRDLQIAIANGMWVSQDAIRALNEMFADVVAICATGDRSAIRKALLYSGGTADDVKNAKYRDFDGRTSNRGWNEREVHAMFAPTRSFIGEYYFDHPDYRNDRGRLVDLVWAAFSAELADFKKDPTIMSQSPQALNERFMARLTALAGFPR